MVTPVSCHESKSATFTPLYSSWPASNSTASRRPACQRVGRLKPFTHAFPTAPPSQVSGFMRSAVFSFKRVPLCFHSGCRAQLSFSWQACEARWANSFTSHVRACVRVRITQKNCSTLSVPSWNRYSFSSGQTLLAWATVTNAQRMVACRSW